MLAYRESVLKGGFLVKYRGRNNQHYTIASNDDLDDGSGTIGGMGLDSEDGDDVALVEMN